MSDSLFHTLSKVEVGNKVRQKGQFWYVSWANAVRELLKTEPKASWEFTWFDGLPYLITPAGAFVECTVTAGEITRKQLLPILDLKNKPVMEPNSNQVNKAHQRCLTKAIALHGFGLQLWAGEDLDAGQDDTDDDGAGGDEQQKQSISDERLSKAISRIQAGEYTVERLQSTFELTGAQLDYLDNFVSEGTKQ